MKTQKNKKKYKKRPLYKEFIRTLSRPVNVPPIFPLFLILIFTFLVIVMLNTIFLIGPQYYPPKTKFNESDTNPECNIFINTSYEIVNNSIFNISYFADNSNSIGYASSMNLFRLIEKGHSFIGESRCPDFGLFSYNDVTKQFFVSFPMHQSGENAFNLFCLTSMLHQGIVNINVDPPDNYTIFHEKGHLEQVCVESNEKLIVFMKNYPLEWFDPYKANPPKQSNFDFYFFLEKYRNETKLLNRTAIIYKDSKNIFSLIHNVLLNSLFNDEYNITILGSENTPFLDYMLKTLVGLDRIQILTDPITCFRNASLFVHHKEPEEFPPQLFQEIADASSNATKHDERRKILVNLFDNLKESFKDKEDFLFVNFYIDNLDERASAIVSTKNFVSMDCDQVIAALFMPMDTKIYIKPNPEYNSLTYSTKLIQKSGREVIIVDDINEEFLNSLI